MPHVIERAATGRAKCRGCEASIPAGAIRFGESHPNPYADDGSETMHWFHVACGALTRPEPFLETVARSPTDVPRQDWLEHEARIGVEHRRLPRARGAERAASSRAACRACREPIAKGAWRIALVYYEAGRFSPSGFVHARCAPSYFETTELIERLKHFSPDLGETEVAEIQRELASSGE
jgi:hypothetical protein